ncbi:hypothetical protein AB0C12_42085 [Actinoplanes sp. NPDC048967]|uniref:hypothetical protein n=1 Tax=Actinoplanes sp. NPDC048967 TaxID=3155269 RepID=UPI0033CEEE6C
MTGAAGHAVAVPADITEPEQAEPAVMGTLERFGRPDVGARGRPALVARALT